MPRNKSPPPEKKSNVEIRADIISYIRNERDTVLKKWMALEESVKSEDRMRDDFYDRITKERTKVLPPTIQKFIGTLKKAVRGIIRHKGGTVFSIIRGMFIYWDSERKGGITESGLNGVMHTLGVQLTPEDKTSIIGYYKKGKGTGQMNYMELLRDVQRGEPHALVFVNQQEEEAKDATQARFQDIWDIKREMPIKVKQFIEATQDYVMDKLRWEGSTPEFHIRHLFHFYDYSINGGLNKVELATAAAKGMNFKVSIEDCEDIINYYDNGTKKGLLMYDDFIKDVMQNVKPVFHHNHPSAEEIEAVEAALRGNPFIRRPFRAPDNKVLIDFQRKIFEKVANKVNSHGGSVRIWIKEAFGAWDPKSFKKFTDPESLIGVAKRLGVDITYDDAQIVMKCYDRYGRGEMHYPLFIKDMEDLDPHFSKDNTFEKPHPKVYQEKFIPPNIASIVKKIKNSVELFSRKSKGHVSPKDVLLGTLIRFDHVGKQRSGKCSFTGLKNAITTLKITNISDEEIGQLIMYYDSNASQLFDYNTFIEQIFDSCDVTTKNIILPKLGLNASGTVQMKPTYEFLRTTTAPAAGSIFDLSDLNATQKKNLDVIESQATKFNRNKQKKKEIKAERDKIAAKIDEIETQQKYIIDDYNARKPRVQNI